MTEAALAERDRELIEAARDVIRRFYQENRHHIGAAVRGRSGRIYSAVHLDTYVGRASVCAEAVALGKAISEGESGIEVIVSVRHPRPAETNREIHVVSPCGICREMLSDFAPGCLVITPDGEEVRIVPVEELLPNKYRRRS
ncbi:MAG: cytidine deaminase [Alphaproteobacteria bacterium]|nr:cytidine deaminase [Alphaproteobacteria bacterium]